jgi:hypothetical protein
LAVVCWREDCSAGPAGLKFGRSDEMNKRIVRSLPE